MASLIHIRVKDVFFMVMEYVVRICKDKKTNETIWTALYVKNERVLSINYFDIDKVVKNYNNEGKYITDVFYEEYPEDVYENIDDFFPLYDDFTHLMDYCDIKIGDTIYMFDSQHVVTHIEKSYRPLDKYKYVHWCEVNGMLSCTESEEDMTGDITLFKVEGSDKQYVWEDYYYQQSFLYSYLKDKGKI